MPGARKPSEEKPKSYLTWQCSRGHVYDSPVPVVEVRCGECAKISTTRASAWMKPVLDLPPK